MKVATALKVRKRHLFQDKDLKQELHSGFTYSTAWIKANKQFHPKVVTSFPPFDIYLRKLFIDE